MLFEKGSSVFCTEFIFESGPDFVSRLLRSENNYEFLVDGLDKVHRRVQIAILDVGVIIDSIVFIVLFDPYFSDNYFPAVK